MNFLSSDHCWSHFVDVPLPQDDGGPVAPSWLNKQWASLYTERARATGLDRTDGPMVHCTVKKSLLTVDQMTTRQRAVYERLINESTFEDDVIWMKTQSLNDLVGVPSEHPVSGRVIDSLMTKYPRVADVHYYIDITDPQHTRYVPKELYDPQDTSRRFLLFNISSAYRNQLHLYSKTYFDPFSRGVEVLHRMKDGRYVMFSICKLMFYMWARKNHVFDFLKDRYEDIARVQREDQQNQRQRREYRHRKKDQPVRAPVSTKHKYRHVLGTLCPADKRASYPPLSLLVRVIPKKE